MHPYRKDNHITKTDYSAVNYHKSNEWNVPYEYQVAADYSYNDVEILIPFSLFFDLYVKYVEEFYSK
jgi:hypothetical protein